MIAGAQATAESTSPLAPCLLSSASATFEWCGGMYSWEDLQEALAVLCNQTQENQEISSCQSLSPEQQDQWARTQCADPSQPADRQGSDGASHGLADPWTPDSWRVLKPDACTLLRSLNTVETVPWVSADWASVNW